MIMNLEKLREILDPVWDKILSVELWGSSIIPYIDNKHDIDISIICQDRQTCCEVSKMISENYNRLAIKREYGFCINCQPLDYDELKHIHAYQCKWVQPLFDFEIKTTLVDILEHKEEYLETLRDYASMFSNVSNLKRATKSWYHIYTALCILDNNSYVISKEQRYNINRL